MYVWTIHVDMYVYNMVFATHPRASTRSTCRHPSGWGGHRWWPVPALAMLLLPWRRCPRCEIKWLSWRTHRWTLTWNFQNEGFGRWFPFSKWFSGSMWIFQAVIAGHTVVNGGSTFFSLKRWQRLIINWYLNIPFCLFVCLFVCFLLGGEAKVKEFPSSRHAMDMGNLVSNKSDLPMVLSWDKHWQTTTYQPLHPPKPPPNHRLLVYKTAGRVLQADGSQTMLPPPHHLPGVSQSAMFVLKKGKVLIFFFLEGQGL